MAALDNTPAVSFHILPSSQFTILCNIPVLQAALSNKAQIRNKEKIKTLYTGGWIPKFGKNVTNTCRLMSEYQRLGEHSKHPVDWWLNRPTRFGKYTPSPFLSEVASAQFAQQLARIFQLWRSGCPCFEGRNKESFSVYNYMPILEGHYFIWQILVATSRPFNRPLTSATE